MDDSKIQKLKKLQYLYQSGALNKDEFETMKHDILSENSITADITEHVIESQPVLEVKKNSPRKSNKKRSKQSHKIRNFILLICLLALAGAGGYLYFNRQNSEKMSTDTSVKTSTSTSKSKLSSSKNIDDKISSSSSQSSKSSQDSDAVAMFHSLDQKHQLAAMYSFAVWKDQTSENISWSDASVISADLNTEKTIVLSPIPGDISIILTDNYDETFNYQIYHVDSVIDEGTVTTKKLNSIAQNDTQLSTWASDIRIKELDK